MTTTYSPSLRLWEGTPGDPAIRNTWGASLNTNDNLIEAAILGTGSVNIGGLTTYTLTTANGAADQARAYTQSFTGALTANCTVTLPNVLKIGWAQNNTSGGYSVILTSGGGSTLTVPAGGQYYWYQCDGAGNITSPSFGFGSLALNSLTVAGYSVVTNNGGTANINIIGTAANATNATNANYATNAGSVPWSGVSSKPYIPNQSVDTNATPYFTGLGTRNGTGGGTLPNAFNASWDGTYLYLWIDNTNVCKIKFGITLNNGN
jgi:hypothetical protein